MIDLKKYTQLPTWMQDNKFILSGYRVNYSWTMCLKSLCFIHNETMNVWTHLLGAGLFGLLWFIQPLNTQWSFDLFFMCTALCFVFSAVLHLFYCRSEDTCVKLQRLDYAGIFMMISGTCFAKIDLIFKTNALKNLYLFNSIFFPSFGFFMTFYPVIMKPEYAWLRATIFVCSGAIATSPVIVHSFQVWNTSAKYFISGLGMYFSGAIFYSTRIPERFAPGYFDLWFHSHSIFHIFVVAGAILHYVSIKNETSF